MGFYLNRTAGIPATTTNKTSKVILDAQPLCIDWQMRQLLVACMLESNSGLYAVERAVGLSTGG